MAKQNWNDLTVAQRRGILAGGAVELAGTAWVLLDLLRRPAAGIRGPKWAWAAACVVQPFGPLAYALLGRRR
ncbi:PLD nuclease N-terminal domain-containing protein [Amnibacterium sp.]|uniref:PLD nuclease N-terminal domain-containing protein n=1 Tax=Amnibacterium sp. TaxID=1872496 RepID=UPI0026301FFE|nr:PLD nuclease N-terminal domain-containing protein [Amnibacterium sp.]MCU1472291.1 PLDc protein [Amnibacterium sp.]